jgi:hypothetical protein
MKFSDDYDAKFKIWAQDPKPQLAVATAKLPKFSPQRFNSYEEFNRWKDDLIRQMAREIPRQNGE